MYVHCDLLSRILIHTLPPTPNQLHIHTPPAFPPKNTTDCLYDVDIPPDVDYLHVQLVAKELPPLEFVREVGAAANAFWAQHPEQYIAIHCAYGTGVSRGCGGVFLSACF